MNTTDLIDKIFSASPQNFYAIAEEVFKFQYQENEVYKAWCNGIQPHKKDEGFSIRHCPFLPISFFKTHHVVTTSFKPEQVFESSGTTQTINSKHFVKDISIYQKSFIAAFEAAYGSIKDWCIIGLLPSYLERNNSSLVFMVNELIEQSQHPSSGFYLYDFEKLYEAINKLEKAQQKTLVIGVTFALLDFAETNLMQLQHTIIMETGGMKGRKREMTRLEIHLILQEKLGIKEVHSEYGMTELLSQAYSSNHGKHICPPWMKVFVRDEEDPLQIKETGKGVLNIIDLANIYSCSFIATDDVGEVFDDGSFSVYGRLDNSDLRGCSLMFA